MFRHADGCVLGASCGSSQLCMTCRLLMLVEDARGDKRHSLQAVELSRRLQTVVQIVSKPPNGARLFGQACHADPLALILIKVGDGETNPVPTTTHKQVCMFEMG